jgi:hypothetical protein
MRRGDFWRARRSGPARPAQARAAASAQASYS